MFAPHVLCLTAGLSSVSCILTAGLSSVSSILTAGLTVDVWRLLQDATSTLSSPRGRSLVTVTALQACSAAN